jgi:toxin ParE1/3/4
MNLIWLDTAEQDLRYIFTYIAEDDVQAAEMILERIIHTAETICHFSHLGRTGRVTKTRELVVTRTPYIIVYRIKQTTVEILTVLHSSRKYPL